MTSIKMHTFSTHTTFENVMSPTCISLHHYNILLLYVSLLCPNEIVNLWSELFLYCGSSHCINHCFFNGGTHLQASAHMCKHMNTHTLKNGKKLHIRFIVTLSLFNHFLYNVWLLKYTCHP